MSWRTPAGSGRGLRLAFLGNFFALLIKSRRFRGALWLAILAVSAIRFFHEFHYDPRSTAPQEMEAVRVGYFLYKQGDWANPYRTLPTGPTAHEPPLYPLMLAGLYHTFGDGAKGAYSVEFVEAVVVTAEVMMIPLVARALGADVVIGFIAAMLAIFGMNRNPFWEANYVGFLLMVSTLLACKYRRSVDASLRTDLKYAANLNARPRSPVFLATALGLLWGVILLTGPSAIPVWVGWLVLGAWYSYHHGARKAWLPALIVPVIMVIPWAMRNDRVLHSPVLLRSNLGLELMISNNPCAAYGIVENHLSGCFSRLHPNENPAEAQRVRDLGEVNYNSVKLRQAIAWIGANPRAFSRLTLQRLLYFWFPSHIFPHALWVVYPATVLSIPGMFIFWRVSRFGTVICMSFLVLYPPIYYVVEFYDRYRAPIMWVTLLLAAVTIRSALSWAMGRLGVTGRAETPSEALMG